MSTVGELETMPESSTVHWKIKDFSLVNAAAAVPIYSPVFEIAHAHSHSEELLWNVVFYPGGRIGGPRNEHTAVGIQFKSLHEIELSMSLRFSIMDNKFNEVFELEKKRVSVFHKAYTGSTILPFCLKTLIYDKTNQALTDDTLLIGCTIAVKTSMPNEEQYDEPDSYSRAYFEKLLESGDLGDVNFEFGDKQMRLHKTIVSSLSPVFLAMFQHQMKEKEESVVKITDVKYEVMKELFRYVYVRKVNDIESIAGDLLVAAEKYDVKGLKGLCERHIIEKLNVDNALENLNLAVKYNATIMKPKVIKYVVDHLKEFVDKAEFEQMDGVCKDELFRAMARKRPKEQWRVVKPEMAVEWKNRYGVRKIGKNEN